MLETVRQGDSMKAYNKKAKKKTSPIGINCLAAVVLILGIIFVSAGCAKTENQAVQDEKPLGNAIASGDGIVIDKSEISKQASFYPYNAGGIEMEVLAVKAPDGKIRTALNTCQVCFDSGAGYYVQEGDELVCQNCGNRFSISKIEKQKNGCNPVPITSEYKIEDDNTITIPAEFLEPAKALFEDWKR